MIKNISYKIAIPVIFLCTFLVFETNAQKKVKIHLTKEEFSTEKDYKYAKKLKSKGLKYYKVDKSASMKKAVYNFELLYNLTPTNIGVNYYLGSSYLESSPKQKCLKHFQFVYDKSPALAKDLLFKLGRGYHLNYQFEQARQFYSRYNNSLTAKEQIEWNQVIQKYIQETQYGDKYLASPERVFIDNLGSTVNTKHSEYAPVITPDRKTIYFTSRRPDEKKKKTKAFKLTGEYYENAYVTQLENENFKEAKKLPKPVNKPGRNTAIVGMNPDGNELVIFNGSKNFGFLQETKLVKKPGKVATWSKPATKMFKNANSRYGVSSASVSSDGRNLFFSTINPKKKNQSFGGEDIYVSRRNFSNEKWGKPVNLGGVINTYFDEKSVFISPDGNTLYFSSDGHTSMGGYDIFKCEKQPDGSWGVPVNLGYPINTPDDDMFFSITANKRYGYYATTAHEDTKGDWDIYQVIFLGPEKPLQQTPEDLLIAWHAKPLKQELEKAVEIQMERLTVVKGRVLDSFDESPVGAKIEIIDNNTEEVLQVVNSNPDTGNYTVNLPSGKNYAMMVTHPEYLFHSENFNIPEATKYQEINKDIHLHKMEAGKKVILNNIFFETGKATLRPSSFPELNYVIKLMNAYKTLEIEISGHTDNVGGAASNQKLSENRAKAVVKYLTDNGIPASRLKFKGYGLTQPIESNKTAEGREKNRRVEFKILKK